ncbi:lysoplasmalogenase [Breznakiella homolactica]|uniref:Lysoplasmalogenase n=1 Tax=Breznakiella homolactica TaxID=2798577 RepID=A0A7T7XQE1_9SPIR|nr:lysoplasmalogenase [Breznakiella homolactica]QQO10468.1 lysoplasmalogenase [Breznakiella homolactica]
MNIQWRPPVTEVVLGLFICNALLHLVFSYLSINIPRAITKVLIMPLLLLFYLLTARDLTVMVILAAVFGWLGDVFLLKISSTRFFRLGLASFLIGHLCYIPAMIQFTGDVHVLALVISLIIAVPLAYLVIKFVNPDKPMRIPAAVYSLVIVLMSVTALQLMLFRMDGQGFAVFIGSLCFLISDSLLAFFTFGTMPKRGSFYIMLPYILAQTFIVIGLAGC